MTKILKQYKCLFSFFYKEQHNSTGFSSVLGFYRDDGHATLCVSWMIEGPHGWCSLCVCMSYCMSVLKGIQMSAN